MALAQQLRALARRHLRFKLEISLSLSRDDRRNPIKMLPAVKRRNKIFQRRDVTRARRTASADWWITPGTAGMRPPDFFTSSRDYRESVGVMFH
ncbi:hypothetical protein EVAR_94860_1 [Eumeta japonica]|uniref:Uncharacterized protein n=1 Tax=Eumeta variegata TaxID=151549 RepID=A0A4C1V9R6_EUMVA|nr:hypothetical protein EVAR_94860_1 [Eumeta japonica]